MFRLGQSRQLDPTRRVATDDPIVDRLLEDRRQALVGLSNARRREPFLRHRLDPPSHHRPVDRRHPGRCRTWGGLTQGQTDMLRRPATSGDAVEVTVGVSGAGKTGSTRLSGECGV